MTRAELDQLVEVRSRLERGAVHLAHARLDTIIARAEAQHAAEDRHHDAAEADAYPINAHQIAAE